MMREEIAPKSLAFWLTEARELMQAAERCWKADETFRQKIAEGRMKLIDNAHLQMRIDAEVELNWLYNILASLSVYYMAIGILVNRDQERFLAEPPEQRIVELVGECGIELDPSQRRFLQRVETALSLSVKEGPWNIAMNPQQLKIMKQKFAQEDTVTETDKRAMDALFAKLISMALNEVAVGLA
jgi:hypothetical protein